MSSCNLMLVSRCFRCLAKKKMLEKIDNLGIVSCALTYLLVLQFFFLGIFQCDLAEIKFDPVASADYNPRFQT